MFGQLTPFFTGVMAALMLSSCSSLKQEVPPEKRDRFAFLHRNEPENKETGKRETIAEEQVSPEKNVTPVVTPEKLKALGVEAADEVDVSSGDAPALCLDPAYVIHAFGQSFAHRAEGAGCHKRRRHQQSSDK